MSDFKDKIEIISISLVSVTKPWASVEFKIGNGNAQKIDVRGSSLDGIINEAKTALVVGIESLGKELITAKKD